VRPDQYETVSTALIWAIGQALGPDFDPPTKEAWRVVLADICDAMKDAAHQP
jgi:hemoglobin-like flavoprotein